MALVISRPRDNPSITHSVIATAQYRYQDYCTLINRRERLPSPGHSFFIPFPLVLPLLRRLVLDRGQREGERERERASEQSVFNSQEMWPDRLSRHLTFPKSLEMYPAKIMKPLFHLFSFHFISPHHQPPYLIVPSRLI